MIAVVKYKSKFPKDKRSVRKTLLTRELKDSGKKRPPYSRFKRLSGPGAYLGIRGNRPFLASWMKNRMLPRVSPLQEVRAGED
jgi:hypothetical protein